MGLYNFQKRFVPAIKSGAKTHTIRSKRKHPDKPGNTMHLYTGLRQKGAELVMRRPCTKVEDIGIKPETALFAAAVYVSGVTLCEDEREQLARRDGFKDFAEMLTFWAGRLPFEGHIIHWRKESAMAEVLTLTRVHEA